MLCFSFFLSPLFLTNSQDSQTKLPRFAYSFQADNASITEYYRTCCDGRLCCAEYFICVSQPHSNQQSNTLWKRLSPGDRCTSLHRWQQVSKRWPISLPPAANNDSIISHFPGFAINPSVQYQSSIFCGLTLDIACAAGQQFSVASSSYHDYLEVSAGSTGSHVLSYWFQSNPTDVAETRHDFAGYIRGGVDVMDIVPGTDRVWSRCGDGGTLVFTNRGAVTGGGGGRSVFNDGAVTTNIEWRSC